METVSRNEFEEILELVNTGKPRQAAGLCEQCLQRNPNDVTVLGLYGAICAKMNDPKAAETYLRRAIELAPDFAKPYEDLGILMINLNRVEEAVPLLENASRLDPENADAAFNLAKALAKLGRGSDADGEAAEEAPAPAGA